MGPAARCISANVDVDQLSRTLRDRLRLPLMLLGIAIAAAAALYACLFGGRYVSTDDAYTQADYQFMFYLTLLLLPLLVLMRKTSGARDDVPSAPID